MSVTNYQGMEMIDAEIVELHARIPAAFAENTGAEGGIMLVVERTTKKEERRRCWAHSSRRHPPATRRTEEGGARRGLGDAGPQRSDHVILSGASPLKVV